MNIWTKIRVYEHYMGHICEQRRFRRSCASAQSRQNLRCSLIQAVNQEEPSDRKPDPWHLWMGHAQLKFVMTEFSKTLICLTRHIYGYPMKDVKKITDPIGLLARILYWSLVGLDNRVRRLNYHVTQKLVDSQKQSINRNHRAEIHKYYGECDWSKKWAEGLQKILTWKVFTDWT